MKDQGGRFIPICTKKEIQKSYSSIISHTQISNKNQPSQMKNGGVKWAQKERPFITITIIL